MFGIRILFCSFRDRALATALHTNHYTRDMAAVVEVYCEQLVDVFRYTSLCVYTIEQSKQQPSS